PPARHSSSSNRGSRSFVRTSLRRSSLTSTITGSSPKSWWNCCVALYSEESLLTSVSVPALVSSCVAAKMPAPASATIGAISSHGQRTAMAAIRSKNLPAFTRPRLGSDCEDRAASGCRAKEPPAFARDRHMAVPVRPAALDHQAAVDRAVKCPPAVRVAALRELRQQLTREAVAVAGELRDCPEHVLVGDAFGAHGPHVRARPGSHR